LTTGPEFVGAYEAGLVSYYVHFEQGAWLITRRQAVEGQVTDAVLAARFPDKAAAKATALYLLRQRAEFELNAGTVRVTSWQTGQTGAKETTGLKNS
jgi:hypothetical protein